MASETTDTDMAEERTESVVAGSRGPQKPVGRPKKGSRPKIDIDDEIQEANRLAEVTKKMMQAAKAAQRNSRRTKQRLVRKAGKLSAADLERIATLKRCGLFAADPADATSSSSSAAAPSSASSSSTSVAEPVRRLNSKLFTAVGQVHGAADLLASMQQHGVGSSSCGTTAAAGGASPDGSVMAERRVPRGIRLSPPGPQTALASTASAPVPSESAPATPSAGGEVAVHADDGDGDM